MRNDGVFDRAYKCVAVRLLHIFNHTLSDVENAELEKKVKC